MGVMMYTIEYIGEGEISLFKVGKMKKGKVLHCSKEVANEFSDNALFIVIDTSQTVTEIEEI